MSWVDTYVATHGLDEAAADELRFLADGPLSGMLGSLLGPGPAAEEAPDELLRLGALLGRGAVGEVYRATDPRLHREVAAKVLRADRQHDPHAMARFLREAQVLASLQHPAIPAVYDVGTLPDGRPFVAMREVRGTSLRQVALAHHGGERPLSLQRRVRMVQRLAEAVGHAHQLGIVHRDIKPANVMLDQDGTLQLVDWGLAAPEHLLEPGVVGTPSWIAPEVLAGDRHGPAADVFAIGRVLHGLLEPGALDHASPPSEGLPGGLRGLLVRALASTSAERWPDGAAMARALGDWLDGAERLKRARQLVVEAAVLSTDREGVLERLSVAQQAAHTALDGVRPFDPVEAKREGWAQQDAAEALRGEADELLRRRLVVLEEALALAPELPEALGPLASAHRRLHEAARATGDARTASSHLERVRRYDRGAHAAWLEGLGQLVLVTDPPGAKVTLCTYTEHDRRWVPHPERVLGHTPLDVTLPHGRYLLRIEAEGRAPVDYPIRLQRLQRWAGGLGEAAHVVYLPRADELGPGERYVPGGPFVHGADGGGFQSLPETEAFLPGFVMAEHPVTHGDYLAYLNALVDEGKGEEAARRAPRDPNHGMDGTFYGRDEATGHYRLVPDSDGDLWRADWPLFFVDFASAGAYGAWLGARQGKAWRLPRELEHEKALRGADGRIYPWGDHFDATFTCVRDSHEGRPLPAPVSAYPADRSVYGVRGLAGNVRAWCTEPYAPPGGEVVASQRVLRGGCFFFTARGAHGAARMGLDAHRAGDTVGVRLVRDLPGDGG